MRWRQSADPANDVQVKQDGRLLARVRRAGRCVDERRSTGIFHDRKLARQSTLLR